MFCDVEIRYFQGVMRGGRTKKEVSYEIQQQLDSWIISWKDNKKV